MRGSERCPLTEAEDDRRMLAQWASECVERVLPLFEEWHLEDDRPRKAVEAAQAFARGEIRVGAGRRTGRWYCTLGWACTARRRLRREGRHRGGPR
jgi:predicted oxidoreductase